MKSNLRIILGDTTVEYEVEWDGQSITGINCDPVEDFFCSDKYEHLWDSGEYPDMTVIADNGYSSNVRFEEVTFELYSNKKLVE